VPGWTHAAAGEAVFLKVAIVFTQRARSRGFVRLASCRHSCA